MLEEDLKAYQGLQKQGAVLLKSPRFGLVVVATKLPNLTVTTPFRIPVTKSEFNSPNRSIPTYYQGPDIKRQQTEFCVKYEIRHNPSDIIPFKGKKSYAN
jgi:hypothetical protein